MLCISLLGPPHIELDGVAVTLDTRHTQALLVYLVVTHRNHQRDTLATLLWPENGQAQARSLLRSALHVIRQSIEGEWIIATRETLGMNPDADYWVDVNEFRELLEKCNSHGHADGDVCMKCIGPLRSAVDMYTDSFLTGFTLKNSVNFDNWQLSESEDLSYLMESAIERLTLCLKSHGDYTRAISYARRWLKLDNLNEAAHRELIDLYGKSGHRSAALKQYDECERILEEELGILPDETTVEIYENLKKNRSTSGLSPYQRRIQGAASNLPTQNTSFIGRKREKDNVQKLLLQSRLVSLTGAGGSGKSRLSIEVAAELTDQFADGVWFVELAPISDPDFIAPAIAKVLDVTDFGTQSMLENLKRYLQDKELLLVLDNFEHLIVAAPVVTDLLASCDHLKVLVTSREVLRLEGELEYPVLPMQLPENAGGDGKKPDVDLSEYEAIRLFAERSAAVSEEFALTEASVHVVAEICERLDGLPLAIELAAAGTSVFKPDEILQRLKQHLPVLAKGPRNLPTRQQTLHGTIDWSYDLLDESEKVLYRRLSVFAGGCTLEAAEFVCGTKTVEAIEVDVFQGLRSLTEKSLLRREAARFDSRFYMLETVKEHAFQRLQESGEGEAQKRRHLDFFVRLTEGTERAVYGPEGTKWIGLINSELDNIRSAITFGRDHDPEGALRIAGALGDFWRIAGLFTEGREWIESLLKTDGEISKAIRAKAASWVSYIVSMQGENHRAIELCDYALTLSKEVGDKQSYLWSLLPLSIWLSQAGRIDESLKACEECVSLARKNDDKHSLMRALSNLGTISLLQEDMSYAESAYEEGLEVARELGCKFYEAVFLGVYSVLTFCRQDYKQMEVYCRKSLSVGRQTESNWLLCQLFYFFSAALIFGKGLAKPAAVLFGVAEDLGRGMGGTRAHSTVFHLDIFDKSEQAIRNHLDESTFQAATDEGRKMTLEEAVEYALREDLHSLPR